VLNTFHPDALELFEVSSNLRKVAEELNDPNTRLKSTGLALFHPVKPMLASRRSPEEMGKLLAHSREPSYIIETKFDGERLQIHKDRNVRYYGLPIAASIGPSRSLSLSHSLVCRRSKCSLVTRTRSRRGTGPS